ncbi:MAG: serine/threonine-protein kinase, partial [Candidatus Eremiobacterota bacterium]
MEARVVGGRYQLGREIGRGGFGRVYLARDLRHPEQRLAVKELALDLGAPAQAEQVLSFFDQEQKILSWLSHPAIVRRQEAIAEGNTVYLVMEYVDGVTLEDILRRYPDPLPQGLAVSIGEQVAEILAYLHSQKPHPIIFRDMKPSNLIVTTTGQLKLIDFGIARLYNRDAPPPVATPAPDGAQDATTVLNTPGATLVLGRGQDTHCMGTPGYA